MTQPTPNTQGASWETIKAKYSQSGWFDNIWDITELDKDIQNLLAKERAEGERELKVALHALGLMWNQYCGEQGHLFMSAGEAASDVLEHHGLLRDEYSEVDWDKLDKLIEEARTLPADSTEGV